ncbi:D-glycero-alpha-D-manno-heptose-1,7-bisphosphate 7-phosphatase [Robertmurraya kyonggiensis]|uniref:D,D-heptose 1,7-bisphosphate phosphatase n=1 Tax=Robertmurraya kyonggiensis TaxID=1037680 RepID=A0A4V5P309_9BACI|nr:HAD family hydrolase [Robertmurraya kyonggiensis]TKC15510.1 HAD family hydrolase [Robertmurraya kyonggiensis]
MSRPAVFFDRDGVLNEDLGYVYHQKQFKWMPGAMKTIKFLKDEGYSIFVITNQSGVARGLYKEEDVQQLHLWMNEELFLRYRTQIDAFYYCPHHPSHGIGSYKRECQCRKPKPGLIHQAFHDFDIDISASVVIGDKNSDMDAAKEVGITGWLFQGKNLYDFFVNKRS